MPVTANWTSFLLVRGTPFHIAPHNGGIQVQHHYFTKNPLVNGTSIPLCAALPSATVYVTADGTVVFEGAVPSSPPPALYLTVNSWSIELQACWLLSHSSFPNNLPSFQLDRPWRL
eukprot:5746338-Ditylum_brightwellii.AAC.1